MKEIRSRHSETCLRYKDYFELKAINRYRKKLRSFPYITKSSKPQEINSLVRVNLLPVEKIQIKPTSNPFSMKV